MQFLDDYLTAKHGNGQSQKDANARILQRYLARVIRSPVVRHAILSAPDPLALLYVIERISAVAQGDQFLTTNPGQTQQAFRNHEIHSDIERQRSAGESLDLSIRQTTANLAEGLSGMSREVLSERSIRNIHGKSSSKTHQGWEDYIIERLAELGQTIVDDRDK